MILTAVNGFSWSGSTERVLEVDFSQTFLVGVWSRLSATQHCAKLCYPPLTCICAHIDCWMIVTSNQLFHFQSCVVVSLYVDCDNGSSHQL